MFEMFQIRSKSLSIEAENKEHEKSHAMLAFRIPLQHETSMKINEMLGDK
jgi:hypothetical protein